MKKIPFTILLAFVATQVFAQGDKAAEPDKYTNTPVNTSRAPGENSALRPDQVWERGTIRHMPASGII